MNLIGKKNKGIGFVKIAAFMLMFVLVSIVAVKAEAVYADVTAPSGKVNNLKQTGASENSVDIQFDALLDVTAQYSVWVSVNSGYGYSKMCETSSSFTTVSGLAAGNTYYIRVYPFRVDDSGDEPVNVYGQESDTLAVVTAPANTKTNIRQTATGVDNVTIAWDAIPGANGYYVDYCLTEGTSLEKRHLVTGATSAVLTGLASGKNYTAYVTPYRVSAAGYVAYDSESVSSINNLSLSANTSVGAPSGSISKLTQTKATLNGAEISFKGLADKNVTYEVWISKKKSSGFELCAEISEEKYAFTELQEASSYYVCVLPLYKKWDSFNEQNVKVYGTASSVIEIVTSIGKKPKTITQTQATATGISLEWDAVDGASGYFVDYYCAGEKEGKTKKVSKNQITLSKLERNKEYHVYVTPYKKSADGFIAYDESNYTCQYNLPVKPSKAEPVTVKKYWSSIGKINLSTKKIACADGYQYQLYTAYKDEDVKIASAYSTSYSSADIKRVKLKTAAVYKVRVRAYVNVAGKKEFGKWSDWTYTAPAVKVELSQKENKLHASWKGVKGANRYAVYISTDKNGGYKKCAVTTKKSFDITMYGKKKLKAGTKYYVYVVPQKEIDEVYVTTGKREQIAELKLK